MPLQVSKICREIQSPWSLELCTCGETPPVSVQWFSWHADEADLFVLLFFARFIRRRLPMRAYLVRFPFRSSSMNLFFTRMKRFVACQKVFGRIACVTWDFCASRVPWVTWTLLNVRISCLFRCAW